MRARVKLYLFLAAILAEHGSSTFDFVRSLRTLQVKNVPKTFIEETTFSLNIIVGGAELFLGLVLLTS